MNQTPDPLAKLGHLKADGEHLQTIRFRLPWVPTSKKNRTVPVMVGGRPRVIPDSKVTAEEDAIRAIAIGALAFHRQRIGRDVLEHIFELAQSRMRKGSGVGEKRLFGAVRPVVGDIEPMFTDQDVRLELLIHRGANARLDWAEVIVTELGPAPEHKRARLSDVHNAPAVVADALQGVIYTDDVQVAHQEVTRMTS